MNAWVSVVWWRVEMPATVGGRGTCMWNDTNGTNDENGTSGGNESGVNISGVIEAMVGGRMRR